MSEVTHPNPQDPPYRWTLDAIGIDTNQAAAIMLDLKPIDIKKILGPDAQYFHHPSLPWVQGPVAQEKAHVTLLYGLVEPISLGRVKLNSRDAGQLFAPQVRRLLQDLELDQHGPVVQNIELFQTDQAYSVLVARVDDERIIEANRRLRWLPHIDTFTQYRAHVTLAYLKQDEMREADAAIRASKALIGMELDPLGLNFGGQF